MRGVANIRPSGGDVKGKRLKGTGNATRNQPLKNAPYLPE